VISDVPSRCSDRRYYVRVDIIDMAAQSNNCGYETCRYSSCIVGREREREREIENFGQPK